MLLSANVSMRGCAWPGCRRGEDYAHFRKAYTAAQQGLQLSRIIPSCACSRRPQREAGREPCKTEFPEFLMAGCINHNCCCCVDSRRCAPAQAYPGAIITSRAHPVCCVIRQSLPKMDFKRRQIPSRTPQAWVWISRVSTANRLKRVKGASTLNVDQLRQIAAKKE